ncbi:MAG: IS21 family transposase [Deltaproteobacteria bacterium]
MIDPATQAEVLRLFFTEKLSQRQIASRFQVHRRTVAALILRRSVQLERSEGGCRVSLLAPYHERIEALLRDEPSRSAVNILQTLRQAGYLGGITILKDYLRTRRPKSEPKAYLSLEFLPGQAAQVDWGDFGDVFGLGRKVWCFVMVHCWSRLLYVEFTHSANFESFLRCHENAFRFFGGVAREIWYDNLASAVTERLQKLIRFNYRFLAYSGFYGFKPVACNPAAGHEKGRVEDGVRYVRHNFWPGRSFTDLDDLNRQRRSWLDDFANKRLHASTRKIPELLFPQEKPLLLPLREPYDTDEKQSVRVSHQFRVHFDGNEYSVPWRLSGRILTLRADDRTVNVWIGTKRVTCHPRSWKKHERIENPKHKEGLDETKPGAQPSRDLEAVRALGPHASRYLEFLGAQHRSLRAELSRLLALAVIYGAGQLEQTIAQALERGVIGGEHLERLLQQSESGAVHPPPLKFSDPRLIVSAKTPNLKSYDALLFDLPPRAEKANEENNAL